MALQSAAFLRIIGDVWYRSNVASMGVGEDPVCLLMETIQWKPSIVLEVGCANGWRLKKLEEKYGCEVTGIEPSQEAVDNRLVEHVYRSTAEDLSLNLDYFDTIIYGFCFSYIDPQDYFRVLCEGDQVLKNGGVVFLHDRAAPIPVKRHNYGFHATSEQTGEEREFEILQHTMDFPRLWLSNPCYREINRITNPNTFDFVSAMQKDVEGAFVKGLPIPRQDGMLLTPDGHPVYPDKMESAA